MKAKNIIYILIKKNDCFTNQSIVQSLLEEVGLPIEPLRKEPLGKPYLVNARALGWDISLSHSHDYLAVALGKNLRVGIDCEIINPIDITPSLLDLILCPDEQLYGVTSKQQTEKFYEIWTSKEAVSKALGLGLYLPFHRLNLNTPTESLKALYLLKNYQQIKCEIIPSPPNLKVAFAVILNQNIPCEVVSCHDSLF